MRRIALVVALLACAPPPDGERRPPVPASLLRVVTWNVHDLFDATDRQVSPGDGDLVFPSAVVDAKLQRIRTVLARLDPDVIVLQEVENVGLLDRVAGETLSGRGYRSFLREGLDPRGIDVGVLSRVPFEAGPSHLDERAPDGRHLWSRDVLEIHVPLDGRELILVGAHLVSRLDPADDARRRLQAARLREIVDALRNAATPSPAVMIVGDLNDLPASPALAPLLADGALVDLGAGLSPSRGWTWSGDGMRERIDYALLPSRDRSLAVGIDVASGTDVAAVSDHRPVIIDLWLQRQAG